MDDSRWPAAASASGGADGSEEAERAWTVLVVDDEPAVLRTLTRVLRRNGYQVIQASDGAEALRVAAAHPGSVDLLLTDIIMPGMGGRELSEAFSGAHPGVPIVIMSGHTDDVDLLHGIRENSVDFLPKPFGVEEILSKVRDAIGRRAK